MALVVGRELIAELAGRVALVGVLMQMPAAAVACDNLKDGSKGIVREVTDGDTVILDNGLVVRLIGIQAPKLALSREGYEDWPRGADARVALADLVLNKSILLRYGGEERDRHGRVLAQMYVAGDKALWVQQAMLERGMARVYSFPDNRACVTELLAAESRARTMKLGIWSDPYYTVRQAGRAQVLQGLQGHYELVEGRVLKAARAGGLVYLNFGRFWKEDLTVVIEARALRLFAEAGLDPLKLEDALIRVRGWVDVKDGPRIAVTHPEQIEVLASR